MAKKPRLPKDIETKCYAIIHGASVAAGGVGAAGAQIPMADNAVITPIQVGMVIGLAKVFDRNLTKEAALGILKGATASFIGRSVSQIVVGWIPFLGNAINTATAAGLTEAVGWMSAAQFYDEWLREGHSPGERPKSFSEEDPDDAEKEDDPGKQRREELCAQAEQFINGKKDAKGADKDEFYALLDEMEYELPGLAEEDPFRKIYEKLTECMR